MSYFKDKVIIVTGSGSGIGKTTAMMLSAQGARVVINGRNEARLIEALSAFPSGSQVLPVTADIAIPEQAGELIKKTIAHFDKLDVLINNAGVSLNAPFEETEPDVFRKVMEANILGCVYPTQSALPYLEASRGSVVFISSIAGFYGLPRSSAYCASKAALTALSQSLRMEISDKGIHVGIVYVGFTKNDEAKRVMDAHGKPIPVAERPGWLLMTQEDTAGAILQLVRRRRKKVTLTWLGKINSVVSRFIPPLAERIIINSGKRMKKMYEKSSEQSEN